MIELPPNRYLGSLCRRGHDWNGTGRSLRRMNHQCCECAKVTSQKPERKSKRKEYKREYNKINRKILNIKMREYNKEYCQRPEVKERYNIARKLRRKIDPKYKLKLCIATVIRQSLNGNKNGRHWESLVGYTLADLKCHLEKQFKPGMTWDNYGRNGWHIDHIIPISAFNFTSPDHLDFKLCWSLSNLQPLWAFENCSKHDKLEKPFQPSLAI